MNSFRKLAALLAAALCAVSMAFAAPAGMPTNYVTPQDFGARGDGRTDDTEAFRKADAAKLDVYVPAGKYVVNNLDIKSSKIWYFQRSPGDQWFAEGNARLLTSTGVTVSHGACIYNICIDYNGKQTISKRPVGLRLISHFCEIHGAFVSYFYIGVELGGTAHCDYTKIWDLYSWYNYYCGVKIAGTDKAQVNFVSFFDCNVGASGVAAHDAAVKPDPGRGYGFYIATGNGIYINNADVSANETAGIYIDNDAATKQTRGLTVSMLYAEHNKYAHIYYNNGKNASPSSCRSRYIDISNAYFVTGPADRYFVGDVYKTGSFVPPTVNLMSERMEAETPDCWCPEIAAAHNGAQVPFNRFYGCAGNSYKVTLDIMPLSSGSIVFQNVISSYGPVNGFYDEQRVSTCPAISVPVEKGKQKRFTFYVTFPQSAKPLVYNSANYGPDYYLLNASIENITNPAQIYGTPAEGATRVVNGTFQVYIGGWRTVSLK